MRNAFINEVNSFQVEINIAGDPSTALQECRRFCYNVGLCVAVSKTTFVYSGGSEDGVKVKLENYPRFPKIGDDIIETAKDLANDLMDALCQKTSMIVTPEKTLWLRKAMPFEDYAINRNFEANP